MPADIVVGLQFGDEGKGKIIDFLAPKYSAVARYQGGRNAGHTVWIDGAKYVFHMIPSGVLQEGVANVIGNGTVIDINAMKSEMDELRKKGVELTPENLKVSDRAHVIMPYHVEEDQRSSKNTIGTTGCGIGQSYTDKAERTGIRIADFYHMGIPEIEEYMVDQASKNIKSAWRSMLGIKRRHIREMLRNLKQDFEALKPYVTDTSDFLNGLLDRGDNVLCEGAQGTYLDVDHGTYPFVTSSNTTAGNAITGLGLNPRHIYNNRIIGVVKAYTTRVGKGPLPTEMPDETSERIRKRGQEFGASTGRPRRCGWYDAPLVYNAVNLNGVTDIAVMKLDVLDAERIVYMCTNYSMYGKTLHKLPSTNYHQQMCEPSYKYFKGWEKPLENVTRYEDLPKEAKTYILNLEMYSNAPISILSNGPDRNQIIELTDLRKFL